MNLAHLQLLLLADALTHAPAHDEEPREPSPPPPTLDPDMFNAFAPLGSFAFPGPSARAHRDATRPEVKGAKSAPCPTCNALAGQECDSRTLGRHRYHRARVLRAEEMTP